MVAGSKQMFEQMKEASAIPCFMHAASLHIDNERLRSALFSIQCDMLARGTDKSISAESHRERAMATRDDIISILKQP
jgi:hypothetical protein